MYKYCFKKSKNILVAAVQICAFILLLLSSGCSEDEFELTGLPTIDIRFSDGSFVFPLAVRTAQTFVIEVEGRTIADFKSFTVTKSVDLSIQESFTKVFDDQSPEYLSQTRENTFFYELVYEPPASEEDKIVELQFIIEDVNGNRAVARSVIKNFGPGLVHNKDLIMEQPAQDKMSNTFFSNERQLRSLNDVATEPGTARSVDFGFYYDNGWFLNSIDIYPVNFYDLGPSGENWEYLRSTAFKLTDLTPDDLFALNNSRSSNDLLEETFKNGQLPDELGKIELQTGAVYTFATDPSFEKYFKGFISVDTLIVNSTDTLAKIDVIMESDY